MDYFVVDWFIIDGPASLTSFLQDMENYDLHRITIGFDSFDSEIYEKVISSIPTCVNYAFIYFRIFTAIHNNLRIPSQITHLMLTEPFFDIPETVERLFLVDAASMEFNAKPDPKIFEELNVYPSTIVYTKKERFPYTDKSGCRRLTKIYNFCRSGMPTIRFKFSNHITVHAEDSLNPELPEECTTNESIIDDAFIDDLCTKSDDKCQTIAKNLAMKIREMLVADSKDGRLNKERVYQIESSEYNDIDITPFLQKYITTKRLLLKNIDSGLEVSMN